MKLSLPLCLPYAAESFPLNVQGRATGWVAACTKAAGVGAQRARYHCASTEHGSAAIAIMLPTALTLALTARFGRETRGTDLRDLDADSGPFEHGSASRY